MFSSYPRITFTPKIIKLTALVHRTPGFIDNTTTMFRAGFRFDEVLSYRR